MMDKLKRVVLGTIGHVKTKMPKLKQPIKWIIFLYFGLVALLVLTYYAAWIYRWHEGEVVMSDLLSLIDEVIGTSMVAFITFIAGCMVDTDKDGIPDRFEEEEEK